MERICRKNLMLAQLAKKSPDLLSKPKAASAAYIEPINSVHTSHTLGLEHYT